MLPGPAARGTRVTSRTEAADDRLKQCPLARSNNTLDMDWRYPYGRGATVDKNRETASSKTGRSQGMLGTRVGHSPRVGAFERPARTLSNESDEQKPDDRHCQENQDSAKPRGRLRLDTTLWRRIGWPAPELWSVSCHDRIMTSTI